MGQTHHLVSTNLLHLEALLHICENAPGVVSVERRVMFRGRQGPVNLLVDVVTHQGSCWVKVFARKRRALHKKWLGEGRLSGLALCDSDILLKMVWQERATMKIKQ